MLGLASRKGFPSSSHVPGVRGGQWDSQGKCSGLKKTFVISAHSLFFPLSLVSRPARSALL